MIFLKKPMLIIAALCVSIAIYVTNFGVWPRYFNIEWDQEVKLHDGTVMLVHVKKTYERLGSKLSRYEGAVFRENEFAFDGRNGKGIIVLKSRLGVTLIDQVNSEWYAVLFGQGPYGNYPDEMPNRWGSDFSMNEERLIKLKNDQFVPVVWEEAPLGTILQNNLVVGSMTLDILVKFNGKKMTLKDKAELISKYPPGPNGGSISRPLRMSEIHEKKD